MQLSLKYVHVDLLEDLIALGGDVAQHRELEVFLDLLHHPVMHVDAVLKLLAEDEGGQVTLDDVDRLAEFTRNLVKRDDLVCLHVVDECRTPNSLEDLLTLHMRAEIRIVVQLAADCAQVGRHLVVVAVAEGLDDAGEVGG